MPEPEPLSVDRTRCSGCGRCVAACPVRLLTLEVSGHRKTAVLTAPGRCSRCGACRTSCLLEAIVITPLYP